MKYVITWHEREASPPEYERARKHLLGMFKDWKLPAGCTIHECLVREGQFAGYIVFETDSNTVSLTA